MATLFGATALYLPRIASHSIAGSELVPLLSTHQASRRPIAGMGLPHEGQPSERNNADKASVRPLRFASY